MKLKSGTQLIFTLLLSALFFSSCGYTNKAILPYDGANSIAISTFGNKIAARSVKTYIGGLESRITQQVIDEFVRDADVRIESPEDADLTLEGSIIAYEQEAFRYDEVERVDEYRLYIIMDLFLTDNRSDTILWHEPSFTGEARYFITGPRAVSEDEAAIEAIEDLADKILSRVVEDW